MEEAGAEVHRLEAEMAELTKLNGDLEHRNSILETYLELQESPKAGRQAADNEWWLDAGVRPHAFSTEGLSSRAYKALLLLTSHWGTSVIRVLQSLFQVHQHIANAEVTS